MTRIYDNQTPPIKWCLQRIFKKTELIFISSRHSEAVFYHEPALYYGFGKEFSTDTFEECTPIPLNLIKILKFAARERKKKDIQKYLLKPLSKELYERLRKSYPHRHKDNWEQGVNYMEILCDPKDSLFHEKELEKYPFPKDYTKWKEKIILHTKAKRYEEAIFLLNHLFMGDVDDTEEKMREELETRFCIEFNLDPGSAAYNVLLVDDFFFLHIYQFSLVERCDAKYHKDTGKILPKIHFHFECNPDFALKRLEKKKYDLILLDIDFGQQSKNAKDVALEAHDKGIPILMFSKFELAEKYDIFQEELYPLVLPRIRKDLGCKMMYDKLDSRLKEVDNIKENARIQKELSIARDIQKAFLPKKEDYSKIEGLDFWGKTESCHEVTGDYYDFIHLEKSNLFVFVIADVSGKGLPASLIMSGAHTSLHTILQEQKKYSNPEQVIGRLKKIINKITSDIEIITLKDPKKDSPQKMYVTFFYGELNLKRLVLHYVNAGHYNPFIISRNGEKIKELGKGGPPLGFSSEYFDEIELTYESEVIKLEKGDIICLYTDGVTEALNPLDNGVPDWRSDRLQAFVKNKREYWANEIVEEIFETLKKSPAPSKGGDDQTMVIIRVKPD